MKKNDSGYELYYKDLDEYKGHKEETYIYDIPYEVFMEGVRKYFDNQLVNIDGKDNDIWNALVDLECLQNVFDAMEDWFMDRCRKDAIEEYHEYIDTYYDEED